LHPPVQHCLSRKKTPKPSIRIPSTASLPSTSSLLLIHPSSPSHPTLPLPTTPATSPPAIPSLSLSFSPASSSEARRGEAAVVIAVARDPGGQEGRWTRARRWHRRTWWGRAGATRPSTPSSTWLRRPSSRARASRAPATRSSPSASPSSPEASPAASKGSCSETTTSCSMLSAQLESLIMRRWDTSIVRVHLTGVIDAD
uniref:Uncharacterized protein n=1 Tax=Triticum urartu TaxID=4572 RepID=A0A8R7TUY7_TRIUA